MKTDWSETMFSFDEEEAELLATSTIEVYEPVKNLHNTPSEMSLMAVRSAPFLLSDYCSSIRSVSVSSSLSDFASSSLDLSDTLNIEDIKMQLSQCCNTCGVCWKDEHFSFDCSECGGYSMIRPCLNCGGTCGALWTRDFAMSHACHTAKWKGNCKHFLNLLEKPVDAINFITPSANPSTLCGMQTFYPNDLRQKLQKLEIKS